MVGVNIMSSQPKGDLMGVHTAGPSAIFAFREAIVPKDLLGWASLNQLAGEFPTRIRYQGSEVHFTGPVMILPSRVHVLALRVVVSAVAGLAAYFLASYLHRRAEEGSTLRAVQHGAEDEVDYYDVKLAAKVTTVLFFFLGRMMSPGIYFG